MRGFLYSKSWHMNCFKYDVGWGDGKERWFYEEANQGIREFCYLLVRIFFGGTDMVHRFPLMTASDLLVDRFILRISIFRDVDL